MGGNNIIIYVGIDCVGCVSRAVETTSTAGKRISRLARVLDCFGAYPNNTGSGKLRRTDDGYSRDVSIHRRT